MFDVLSFLFIIGLASFKLSILISEENGPFDIFEKLRKLTGVTEVEKEIPVDYGVIIKTEVRAESQLGKLISCPYCLSGWVSLLLSAVFWYSEPAHLLFLYWMTSWGIGYLLITAVKWKD